MNGSTPINNTTSFITASRPADQPTKLRVIESLSVGEALIVEFGTEATTAIMDCSPGAANVNSSPDAHMREISANISNPSQEMVSAPDYASTPAAPLLWNMSVPSDNRPGESYYSVKPPSKSTYNHDRLHSNDAVEAPRAVGSGSNLMAYFDDETNPRTRYELLIEGNDGHGNTAQAILDACMTLPEICEEYPEYVTRSSLVLLFSREGWTSHLIWNNIPRESRRLSPGGCPWSYIDDNLQKQMEKLAAAEAEAGVAAKEEALETQDTATPATKKLRSKTPNWTAADSAELLSMRREGKTHKEIGEKLGRSEAACASRLVKMKKAQEAAAVDKSGQAADTASDPVEVEIDVAPGGQVDDPMGLACASRRSEITIRGRSVHCQ